MICCWRNDKQRIRAGVRIRVLPTNDHRVSALTAFCWTECIIIARSDVGLAQRHVPAANMGTADEWTNNERWTLQLMFIHSEWYMRIPVSRREMCSVRVADDRRSLVESTASLSCNDERSVESTSMVRRRYRCFQLRKCNVLCYLENAQKQLATEFDEVLA